MTQVQMKNLVFDLISTYFSGASVVWGHGSKVRPGSPLVVLQALAVTRSHHPINRYQDGVVISSYPSQTRIQVDLYTPGAVAEEEEGISREAENTAIDDMLDFVSFVNSPYAIEWCSRVDLSLLANEVNDLSQLINDTSWDYRAMTELQVGYTHHAVGHTGTMWDGGVHYDEHGHPVKLPFVVTPSGGRWPEGAEASTGYFEKVITEWKEARMK